MVIRNTCNYLKTTSLIEKLYQRLNLLKEHLKLQIAKRLQCNWGGSKRKTTLSSFWIQLQQNYLLSSWNVFLGLLVIWPIHQVVSFGEPACLFVWSIVKKNMLKEKFCKTYNNTGLIWHPALTTEIAYWHCMSQLGING